MRKLLASCVSIFVFVGLLIGQGAHALANPSESGPSESEIVAAIDSLAASSDVHTEWNGYSAEIQEEIQEYLSPSESSVEVGLYRVQGDGQVGLIGSTDEASCEPIPCIALPPTGDPTASVREDEVGRVDAFADGGVAGFTSTEGDSPGLVGQPLEPGCYRIIPKLIMRNYLNRILWTYADRVDWCQDGVGITSASSTHLVSVSSLFWTFKGQVASQDRGGRGFTGYESFTQGQFEACIVSGFGCFASKTPYITSTVTGSGAYGAQGGA